METTKSKKPMSLDTIAERDYGGVDAILPHQKARVSGNVPHLVVPQMYSFFQGTLGMKMKFKDI